MLITRKAAAGFILLAIIVFATSSFDAGKTDSGVFNRSEISIPNPDADDVARRAWANGFDQFDDQVIKTKPPEYKYRPPILNFGKYNPHAITLLAELFAMVCYLGLKRIEPRVTAWEQAERERVKEEAEQNS